LNTLVENEVTDSEVTNSEEIFLLVNTVENNNKEPKRYKRNTKLTLLVNVPYIIRIKLEKLRYKEVPKFCVMQQIYEINMLQKLINNKEIEIFKMYQICIRDVQQEFQ
ncbi:21377_t:CDS:1, partial [Dentiscutata erythropus]